MAINEAIFSDRYNNLNERQREAVDTIYGPVMVIAGPGTGKTEVLSMRIANLLQSEAQVQPNEILCLTYTDEATNAMRRRLVQIIGTAAHRVNVCTFHAFCNNVIQSNMDYFSLRSLQPITDLERTEMLYEMLEQLPQGHLLRKLSGNIYFDVPRLSRLFDFMKKEHLSAYDIVTAVDGYLDDLPQREVYIYKVNGKGFKKGDLKQSKLDEEEKRMKTTAAAASLFDAYRERMMEAGRYDFTDMILWVLEAFKQNPGLLQSYQERHQFILIDEFQDTNGSQNELINCLTEYWEDPNIFVVGDDDQSIYEFQGARILNIIDFYERYKDTIKIIVLPHNYRSSQLILDSAAATIKNNNLRLIYKLDKLNLNKDLIAASGRFANGNNTTEPIVTAYPNVLQEEVGLVMQIEQLQQAGVALREVAVLYSQHKQADNIMALMERRGIPFNVKKSVNILDLPLVQQIINILNYLEEERKRPFSAEPLLFEIMHSAYFEIASTDIALVSLYIQANRSKDKSLNYWKLLLTNGLLLESLDLKTAKAFRRLGDNLEQWQRNFMDLPLPMMIEKIIYESGIVAHLLRDKNYTWQMQVLHTFFDFVQDTYSRNPRIRPTEFLKMLERMQDEKIAIPAQRLIQNENGVHFFTAHGSKGNEFEHVFLIGCTKNFWEKKQGSNNEYSLPDTITNTSEDTEKTYKTEVARRLFYVALTRAKKHLYISYALADNKGKGLEASVFIDEVFSGEGRNIQSVPAPDMLVHMQWAMEPVPEVRIELANRQYLERALAQLFMSATTLSKYLRCPVSFYYETLLQVPFLKNDALAFGSAVHHSLERMFLEMKLKKGVFPEKEQVITYFKNALFRESESFTQIQYDRRLEQGVNVLTEYYDQYINQFPKNVEIEMWIPKYLLDGVPVNGKIDKMEFDGDVCTIVDYKTGDPDKSAHALTSPPSEKDPNGGDYWRQMVFYKLLVENYQDRNWKVSMGIFDYIQKGAKSNEFKRIHVPMFAQDEAIVRAQIKDSYARIMNQEFDTGCGKESCHWCNFARQYELVRPTADEEGEIDDV